MAGTKRAEGEAAALRALKIDIPAELKTQLKMEAVELDITLRSYIQKILEERVPSKIRTKMETRARTRGMTFTDLLVETLERAGMAK